MKRVLFAALFLFPCAAHADAPALDPQACKSLSAAYTPGVDVHGKPVASADLNAPVVTMPDKFSFDINIDAAKAAGLTVPPGTQALAKVGTVTYDKGVLSFNGKPLDPQTGANLKALCGGEKPAPAPVIEKQKDYNVLD